MEIAIFAGEASGDHHGAMLARELLAQSPQARLWGVGGDRMRGAGVRIERGLDELAVLGFAEVVGRIPFFLRLLKELTRQLAERRPAVVVLIDYPGLNLRLAKAAKGLGIRVAYYISPQVWAWGERRVRAIRRYVDTMIVILPFEEEFFAARGVSARFVGHPMLGAVRDTEPRETLRRRWEVADGTPLVGLLPGSRPQEARRHMPVFLDALERLAGQGVAFTSIVGRAPTISATLMEELLGARPMPTTEESYAVMAAADLLLVSSGTATLEAALFGTPMIVVYKTSAVSYWIGRLLVTVPHIGLANLVAGERVVPELIQGEANGPAIAERMRAILTDGGRRERIRRGLGRVRERLGEPGAPARAAALVLELAGGGAGS